MWRVRKMSGYQVSIPRARIRDSYLWIYLLMNLLVLSGVAQAAGSRAKDLTQGFTTDVHPFIETYCLSCHDRDTRKAELDLTPFTSVTSVVQEFSHWQLVLERIRNGDMPPAKAKTQPTEEARRRVIEWIEALKRQESQRLAGDPGPIPARRLSNAEYDHTIHDLTGVDIRPTRSFPVDPANQAGFDNSGESLSMSPALVKKYLQAAREVSEHLVLLTDGFTFAPHPVMADTDRDKWAVFRIVDFYRRQPTDYADYFMAAWKYQHRAALGQGRANLSQIAHDAKVSPKYLQRIWTALSHPQEEVGPIARLQNQWRSLPAPPVASEVEVRKSCEQMRDFVLRLRNSIVPEVKNLKAPPIQEGSQTMVLWKNRQMAANRRRYDPTALKSMETGTTALRPVPVNAPAAQNEIKKRTSPANASTNATPPKPARHIQAPTPDTVLRGGFSLPPTVITKESSATARMAAAKHRGDDVDLLVPADPLQRALHEEAFARFADLFPDAFYISERARVYLDAEKEQENAGRLLSAGLHSMTGYFRDDQPLYDLILDESGQKELDRLWDEFDMVSLVPQRMHTSFTWFERTDSQYMRDPEFDPYRPEDKTIHSQEKIRSLAELYLAKARRNNASETALVAIQEHFDIVATQIARVERMRLTAENAHRTALENFAARAYRRPLTSQEKEDLRAFYRDCRQDTGINHEEAMRDCIVRVLMSPWFSFRMDLVEAAGRQSRLARSSMPPPSVTAPVAKEPLSDQALACRLSYFLWSSMPDDRLLALAVAGKLHHPEVLRTEARRMLRDPRVMNFATDFAGNWLDFRRFEEFNSVDRERFPVFNNDLRKAMFEEPLRFFIDVAHNNRPVLDFLYAPDTFVNGPLARHYGITPAPEGTQSWVHILNARDYGRGGMLPMAVFLTANSPGLRTSPVKRGYWVVRRMLGERIPPPPATVPELPKDEKGLGNRTLREVLAQHRERSGCAECHARFDSFGLVFESFGPVGERRELDLAGNPVDTRAEFPNGKQGSGLVGMLEYIHQNREDDFLNNFCRKLLAYGLGRTLILGDEPLVEQMRSQLRSDGFRFGSLVETIVTSPQFRNKRSHSTQARN